MSHDTHEHHDEKPVVQFKTGIIFPLMLIGLFLASIAFVQSMSHSDKGHGDTHGTQHHESTHGTEQQASEHNANQHGTDAQATEGHKSEEAAHQENHH